MPKNRAYPEPNNCGRDRNRRSENSPSKAKPRSEPSHHSSTNNRPNPSAFCILLKFHGCFTVWTFHSHTSCSFHCEGPGRRELPGRIHITTVYRSEVLPIRRDRGSYSPVCLRLFYSASDPTKRVHCLMWGQSMVEGKKSANGEGSILPHPQIRQFGVKLEHFRRLRYGMTVTQSVGWYTRAGRRSADRAGLCLPCRQRADG